MSTLISRFNSSYRCISSTRCLAITAMFVALKTAMTLCGLTIRLTPSLRIDFGFICSAGIAMLFGPVMAMLSGACMDILGYFAGNFTMGGYFPGYTVTAVLSGLIYGLWLYHPDVKDISKGKKILYVICAKTSINLICNVCLNTLWLVVQSGNAMSLLLPPRLIKNIICLPFECIILFFAMEFLTSFQKHLRIPSTK